MPAAGVGLAGGCAGGRSRVRGAGAYPRELTTAEFRGPEPADEGIRAGEAGAWGGPDCGVQHGDGTETIWK